VVVFNVDVVGPSANVVGIEAGAIDVAIVNEFFVWGCKGAKGQDTRLHDVAEPRFEADARVPSRAKVDGEVCVGSRGAETWEDDRERFVCGRRFKGV
jgi:hypothetical protein